MEPHRTNYVEQLLGTPPFGLKAEAKNALYIRALSDLTRLHYERSAEFRKIAKLFGYDPSTNYRVEDLPYLPARLFKEFESALTEKTLFGP
jgi:hypothetical protein